MRARLKSKIEILELLGDLYAKGNDYEKAYHYHEAVLQQKQLDSGSWTATDLVTSYSALATDATNLFRFEDALTWIRQAQTEALPAAPLAILYQQESSILECQDDFISALHVFEHSLKLAETKSEARLHQVSENGSNHSQSN